MHIHNLNFEEDRLLNVSREEERIQLARFQRTFDVHLLNVYIRFGVSLDSSLFQPTNRSRNCNGALLLRALYHDHYCKTGGKARTLNNKSITLVILFAHYVLSQFIGVVYLLIGQCSVWVV